MGNQTVIWALDASINVKVKPATRRAFKAACAKNGTTMSAVLRTAIAEAIARAGKETGNE